MFEVLLHKYIMDKEKNSQKFVERYLGIIGKIGVIWPPVTSPTKRNTHVVSRYFFMKQSYHSSRIGPLVPKHGSPTLKTYLVPNINKV